VIPMNNERAGALAVLIALLAVIGIIAKILMG
jgi:hypothetical protein